MVRKAHNGILVLLFAAAALLAVSLPVVADGADAVRGLKATYEKSQAKIDVQFEERKSVALGAYVKAVGRLEETMRRQGKLEGTLAAVKERERLATDETVPEGDGVPPVLAPLRRQHAELVSQAKRERDEQTARLLKLYIARLLAVQKKLTVQDEVDEALQVRDEATRAEFVLADVSSRLPDTVPPQQTKKKQTPSASELEAKRRRLLGKTEEAEEEEVVKTKLRGHEGGTPFEEEARKGYLLAGFTTTSLLRGWTFSIQPIFVSPKGNTVRGDVHGRDVSHKGKKDTVVADPGYAVGQLTAKSGDWIDGFSVTFMKIREDGTLDAGDSYESRWLGGSGGGGKRPLLTERCTKVVGIWGNHSNGIGGLGLIYCRRTKAEFELGDDRELVLIVAAKARTFHDRDYTMGEDFPKLLVGMRYVQSSCESGMAKATCAKAGPAYAVTHNGSESQQKYLEEQGFRPVPTMTGPRHIVLERTFRVGETITIPRWGFLVF